MPISSTTTWYISRMIAFMERNYKRRDVIGVLSNSITLDRKLDRRWCKYTRKVLC